MTKKILLVGSQHGNEKLGDQLLSYITDNRPELLEHVDFIIGNPRAHRKNVRFTETDMNRSYGVGTTSYESRCANRIERHIRSNNYELILDLHTTTSIEPPCLIVDSINDINRRFLVACHIEHIVVMADELAKRSLIGRFENTVCIEVQADKVTAELLERLSDDLVAHNYGLKSHSVKKVYDVELLLKGELSEKEAKDLSNFEMSEHGFVPILVGGASYKRDTHYLGFKAHTINKINLSE